MTIGCLSLCCQRDESSPIFEKMVVLSLCLRLSALSAFLLSLSACLSLSVSDRLSLSVQSLSVSAPVCLSVAVCLSPSVCFRVSSPLPVSASDQKEMLCLLSMTGFP